MTIGKKILTYCCIAILAFITSINYEIFVFPNNFAPAGINGICTMIQHIFGINLGYLSLIINVPLAILVYFKVSKSLAFRSMIYVLVFSCSMLVMDKWDISRFAYITENGTSTILGPLVAGILVGGCYGLLIRVSAYTGGIDFVAAVIHKYRPDKNIFWLIFIMNVIVALASFFVFDYKIEPVIMCILYCFASSTVSDKMTKQGRSAIRFEIITDSPEEISNQIIHRLHHSATLIPGKGMYLGKEVNILICVVNRSQAAILSSIIRQYPNTFAVMSQVGEVMGNFKKIDTQGNLEKQILDQGDIKIV